MRDARRGSLAQKARATRGNLKKEEKNAAGIEGGEPPLSREGKTLRPKKNHIKKKRRRYLHEMPELYTTRRGVANIKWADRFSRNESGEKEKASKQKKKKGGKESPDRPHLRFG